MLKTKKRKGTSVTLSEKEINFLDLMALHGETKRSPILSSLIKKEYKNMSQFITGITLSLWNEWLAEDEHDFPTYLRLIKIWLQGNRIAGEHINMIVKELKETYAANQQS